MSTTLTRRTLTDTLISTIATATNKACGDGTVPAGVGWIGQPNSPSSSFIPYTVLQTGTASRSSGSLADPQTEWQLPYSVWSFGVRRDQCEGMADLARSALSSLAGTTVTLGTADYKVQQVWTDSIGSTTRYDQFDPAYWGQLDALVVWLSQEG